MRSAVLAGLVLLAGCDRTASVAVVETTSEAATVLASQVAEVTAKPGSMVVPPTLSVLPRHAFGTEPFWSFEIRPDTLRYSTPEVMGIELKAKLERKDGIFRFTAVLQDKPMVLTIESGECSDGMSDNLYRYKAEFTWRGKTERGCAKLT